MKHAKVREVSMGQALNKLMWERGMRSPPNKVKVQVVEDKENNKTWVELEGVKMELGKKEEKKEEPKAEEKKPEPKKETKKPTTKKTAKKPAAKKKAAPKKKAKPKKK